MNPQLVSELEAALSVYRKAYGDPEIMPNPVNACSPLCKNTCENQCSGTCIRTVAKEEGAKCNVGGHSRMKVAAARR